MHYTLSKNFFFATPESCNDDGIYDLNPVLLPNASFFNYWLFLTPQLLFYGLQVLGLHHFNDSSYFCSVPHEFLCSGV